MPKPLTVWITTNCRQFWKRWEYQTTWPASWETYMQVRKQVWTGHGTTDWFQIGKGVRQGCILSQTIQFSSVQSLSCVWLFATPWIAAQQAALSITNSRSSLKLMSIESVMPWELQFKTIMRYYLTAVRMTIIKKSANNKSWSGCGEKGTLQYCLWECTLVQPLWRTVCCCC